MRVAFTLSASLSANGGKKAKAWFCLFRGIVLCAPHSSFLHKQKYLQFGVRGAPNAVNFAERPLAGIHAKLTKLRDNIVVAMAWFLLLREIIAKESYNIISRAFQNHIFGKAHPIRRILATSAVSRKREPSAGQRATPSRSG